MAMINLKNAMAALALGVAVAAAASPALAKDRARSNAGQDARAQAIRGEIGENGMSSRRANALRVCNERANRYLQHTYGNMQSYAYHACMIEHSEIE